MILDTRYTNQNFKKSKNKLIQSLDLNDSFVELNTKYHTIYTLEEKKKTIRDAIIFWITSNVLYCYLIFLSFSSNKIYLNFLILTLFIMLFWNMYQILFIKSISYGSRDNLIPHKEIVSFEEYIRYYEISLPKETMPYWMKEETLVYSKDSFDNVLAKFNEEKIESFIKKYKKLAFKSNKVISNNKKILSSWLKKERENLVVVHKIPLTLIDYRTIWLANGFPEHEVEKMVVEKMNELEEQRYARDDAI